ncbi:hypothetical protein CYY_003545 [Polysphondylium violaceum]|uniref:G domain-containing protein n=1 Tax=Polysphondylium violaceum TaxID=133409 RepID=A0A8J4PXJ7_9MYCE|nr:hypothetical protein CYY_003545 [Polysphondylium violaceum]
MTEILKGTKLDLDEGSIIDAIENSKVIISFYGNPGSGKSTLLNALNQKVYFTSGISSNGSGVTSHSTIASDSGITYMDTPGLSDPTRKKEIIQEIQNSLIENKNYKIVFLCTLHSGRLAPTDMTTINTVLSAVPQDINISYGIIYNKLTPRIMKTFQESDELSKFHKNLLDRQPSHVLLLERLDELEDAEDKVCENQAFVDKIRQFIQQLQYSELKNVQQIKSENYDQMVLDLESKYSELLKEKEREIEKLRQETELKLKNTIVGIREEIRHDKEQYNKDCGHVRTEKSFYRWKPVTLKYKLFKTMEKTTTFKRIITTKASGQETISEWEAISVSEIDVKSWEQQDKSQGW